MVYHIIWASSQKEGVMEMEEFLMNLAVAATSAVVTVLAETAVGVLKEKTSRKHGKHERRS